MCRVLRCLAVVASLLGLATFALAQEQSVKPGINDAFRNPDPKEFVGKFEVESREVFVRRKEILAECQIEAGQVKPISQ